MQINRCCIHILTRCQGEKGSLSFRQRHKHTQGEEGGPEGTGRREGGAVPGIAGRGGEAHRHAGFLDAFYFP